MPRLLIQEIKERMKQQDEAKTDDDMREIVEAMIPQEAEAAAGDDVGSGAEDAGNDESDAGKAEDARTNGTADGDWVTEEEIEGVKYRRLGRKANRAMIVVLPAPTAENIRISEMTALAAIPSGYQIVEAVIPEETEPGVAFLRALYDRLEAEGIANIYFLGYDTAVPVGMQAFKDKPIRRAYFVSPVFYAKRDASFWHNDDVRWRIETEILRGSRDEVVPEKEIRHFMKNAPSHLSKIDMGHYLTTDDQLNAFGRWLTGARSGRYNDNGFIILMAAGLLIGYLAGWFLFKNSAAGLIAGFACGIALYFIYRKI